MAKKVTIRDNTFEGPLTAADIVDGVIFTSEEQLNSVPGDVYKAADIHIIYENMDAEGHVEMYGIVEGKAPNGAWYPVATQFNGLWEQDRTISHTITVNPDVFWPDAGVPNVIWAGGTIGYVSPQAVTLPETWRVKIKSLVHAGSTLASLDVSIYSELVNKEA